MKNSGNGTVKIEQAWLGLAAVDDFTVHIKECDKWESLVASSSNEHMDMEDLNGCLVQEGAQNLSGAVAN